LKIRPPHSSRVGVVFGGVEGAQCTVKS